MNPFYTLYARTYQTIFRIALPILPYRDPKIINHVEEIAKVIKSNHKTKPMIVTDNSILALGLCEGLFKHLDECNISYSVFSEVCPNPTSDVVNNALKQFKEDKCDCLIALGGGSVMDTAKALGALCARPKKKLSDLAGILHVRKKIPTLIAIPTTCGTGSETTLAAVITDSETRHKYAINDFPLIPSYAVLDCKLIKNLPSKLVSTTGLDALTHALEAYLGRSTTKKTRADALEAIDLIFKNIEDATKNHTDDSLQNMLVASHKAGRAFSKSYVGYVHAIAHTLGGKYNVPHGYANAVILPHVLKEYGKKIYKKIAKIYDYIGLGDKNVSKEEKYNVFMARLTELCDALNIDKHIDCIKEEDIDQMVKYALHEANPLYPVPVMWDKKQMKKMFYIVKGTNHDTTRD